MYCVKCGKEINNDSSFCSYCGNKVINTTLKSNKVNRDKTMRYKETTVNKLLRKQQKKQLCFKILIICSIIAILLVTFIIQRKIGDTYASIPAYIKRDRRSYITDLYEIEKYLQEKYGEDALSYSRLYEFCDIINNEFWVVTFYKKNESEYYELFSLSNNVDFFSDAWAGYDVHGDSLFQTDPVFIKHTIQNITESSRQKKKGEAALYEVEILSDTLRWSCEIGMNDARQIVSIKNISLLSSPYTECIDALSDVKDSIIQYAEESRFEMRIVYRKDGLIESCSTKSFSDDNDNSYEETVEYLYTDDDFLRSIVWNDSLGNATSLGGPTVSQEVSLADTFYYEEGQRHIREGYRSEAIHGESVWTYDSLGRIISKKDLSIETNNNKELSSWLVEYTYDEERQFLRSTDISEHGRSEREYDLYGNLIYEKNESDKEKSEVRIEYQYGNVSGLITQTLEFTDHINNENDHVIYVEYDALGRPLKRSFFDINGILLNEWETVSFDDEKREAEMWDILPSEYDKFPWHFSYINTP